MKKEIMEDPFDFDEDFTFDNDEDFNDEPVRKQESAEPDSWTIVTALNRVANKASRSNLAKTYWTETEKARAFLRDALNLSDMQLLFIAILTEEGDSMSWHQLARYIGCPRLELLSHVAEMEDLIKKRWIQARKERHGCKNSDVYGLVDGVVEALSHNHAFQPEVLSGMSEQTMVDRLQYLMNNAINRGMNTTGNEINAMLEIVEANPEIPFCKEVLKRNELMERMILLLVAVDYSAFGDTEDEGLIVFQMDRCMPDDWEYNDHRKSLTKGCHPLIKEGLLEHKCEEGIADCNCMVLSPSAKEIMLPQFSELYRMDATAPRPRNLKCYESIPQKTLFFNHKEREQISRLANLLDDDKLKEVQKRLEEKNMRKGFTCLFYGGPGTGKTETVYQLARSTGRDLMEVNIAGLRDKFVGDSEKNIKAVFNRYRKVCANSQKMPILFFNEADAIINKRTENIEHSVDKMDNAMQNIILQELENLDGILIATTNLTSNLDSAFDRRFLFKVEFKKPAPEVKAKIWNHMLEDLSEEEAEHLANKYDFSGGQIENISRKQNIDYILTGEKPSLERLEGYCKEEVLDKKGTRASIGFRN